LAIPIMALLAPLRSPPGRHSAVARMRVDAVERNPKLEGWSQAARLPAPLIMADLLIGAWWADAVTSL
jgi:hypothetical protein